MGCSESNVGCTIVLWAAIYSVNGESFHYFLWHGHWSPHNVSLVGMSVRPSCPSTFTSKFDIYVKVFVFSASVIAVTMKPCIVIVLDIPFKHTP